MIYHIFFCLWLMFFFSALHSIVMAGSVAAYYWTRDKSTLSSPISSAIARTLRYHIGSALFGSLVLSIVKIARWILTYLSTKIKKHTGGDSAAVKFLLCCFNCCLWCLEKFIKFLTKNAYIMIAVDGTSFCKSAQTSWNLIMSNVLRMTSVSSPVSRTSVVFPSLCFLI